MVKMTLELICLKNMSEAIKKMPPLMQEKVIGFSLEEIREEERRKAREEIYKEITEELIFSIGETLKEKINLVKKRVIVTDKIDYISNLIADNVYDKFLVPYQSQYCNRLYNEEIECHVCGESLEFADEETIMTCRNCSEYI